MKVHRDDSGPWLHLNELFWDATGGRQVWAEITFKGPTDVKALTVREGPKFPQAWPTQGVAQVWDEGGKRCRNFYSSEIEAR